jgi:hypothetical protein
MFMPTFNLASILTMAKQIALVVALWTAFRAFIMGLVTLVVPVIIYKGWLTINEQLMSAIGNVDTSGLSATTLQLTGLAAWAATQLKIPECVAILMTGVSTAIIFKMIKR